MAEVDADNSDEGFEEDEFKRYHISHQVDGLISKHFTHTDGYLFPAKKAKQLGSVASASLPLEYAPIRHTFSRYERNQTLNNNFTICDSLNNLTIELDVDVSTLV